MNKLFSILILLVLLSSCYSKDDRKIIASYNEKYLFLSDVIVEMPKQIEDSSFFVQKFINNWIRKELLISYAEMNLVTDLIHYEKQIEDYRASLLIYAYQQEVLNQNFDTTVAMSEIIDYFDQYKNEFKLSKNIFKGRFIMIDKSAPNLNLLDSWYKSEKENTNANLEDYCQQFSKEYYLKHNKWQYFSVFNNMLPDYIFEEEYFLRNTKGVFFEDEDFRYYVYIKDYLIKGSNSPLGIQRERIRDVILNKKKIQYLQTLEDELYQNALANKKIKIY